MGTVPDTALFLPELMLPLLPLLPLPSAPTAPPPPLEPTSLTATLPPATTGRILLEQSTLPTTMCTPDSLETTMPPVCLDTPMLLSPVSARGRLNPQLTPSTATATDMDMDTDTPAPSPPEFPPSLTPGSPSRVTLRATATATMVTNRHICSGLTRL